MKQNVMVKFVALLLCATMLFLGVACAAPAETAPAAAPAQEAAEPAAEPAKEPAAAEDVNTDPIKVSFLGPMTGNNAIYGISQKEAVILRMDQYNEAGGYNGRKVELTFYDDKCEAKEGVNCAQMVINDPDTIAVIGPWSSTVAFAVEPLLTKAGIILYATSASHPDLTNMSEYVVRQTLVQTQLAKVMATRTYEHGLTKAAFLFESTNDGAVSCAENFTKNYEELGGTVINDGFQNGTKDFSPLIAKYKEEGIDNLQVFASYSDAALLITQARELDLDCIIVLVGSATQPELFPLIEGQENVFCADPYLIDYDSDFMRDFVSAYTEKTGGEPSVHAYLAYCAADHLLIGIEKCGTDDVKALADFLRNDPDYEGPLGKLTFVDGTPNPPIFFQRFNGKDGFVYDAEWN